jgi:hypothetical protein
LQGGVAALIPDSLKALVEKQPGEIFRTNAIAANDALTALGISPASEL